MVGFMDSFNRIEAKLDKLDEKLDLYLERIVRVEERVDKNTKDLENARGWIKSIFLLTLGGICSIIIAGIKFMFGKV